MENATSPSNISEITLWPKNSTSDTSGARESFKNSSSDSIESGKWLDSVSMAPFYDENTTVFSDLVPRESVTNSSTDVIEYETWVDPYSLVPVYGANTTWFHAMHTSALTSLSVSLTISGSILLYILYTNPKYWRLTIGERLVIYLAMNDVLFNITHMFDHSSMMHLKGHPPPMACAIMGLFLHEFVCSQALIVLFTSVNAFFLAVKERRLDLGAYDWRLLVYAYVPVFFIGLIGVGTGYFGPNGAWCYIHRGRSIASILDSIVSSLMISTYFINITCYTLVWIKIRKSLKKIGEDTKKFYGAAKVMMFFVIAYIAQWWSYTLYSILSLFEISFDFLNLFCVLFTNCGGFFILIAYLFVIKKKNRV